ncbi:hypothetical protein NYE92_22305 [Pantoea sp. B566]|uniref:TIR domain-containing protein n=1 Tax=Pantoea sp. B566 TaxID=2974030 RepID=UPI0021654094|nr:hypothetical protein [Pantoea sp. B566]MCS3405411.1 hypothetical protein [Pantoea sp. B566]
MGNSTRNYCAFYVSEPFDPSRLGAHATRDFVYYNLLKSWKAKDDEFPFNNAHDSTYNVRDSSDWESTLKPRLRERLGNSKNIIFFLSSQTKASKAVTEEFEYGMGKLGLPVIVIYPELSEKSDIAVDGNIKASVKKLWDLVPAFKSNLTMVPTLHVPMDKELIKKALTDKDFMVNSKASVSCYFFK